MSSEPPIRSAERPNGAVRRRRRRGRIKLEARNISQMEKVEMTYLGCTGTAQPPANAPKRRNGVHTTKRRRGRIKIEPIKVNPAQDLEKTYLERASAAQPPRNDPKRSYRVIGLGRWRWRRDRINIESVKPKIKRINDKTAREDRKTHLERIRTAQPPGNPPKRRYGVIGLIRQRGRIKSGPTIVSQTREGGNAYLGRANAIRSIWRPKRQIRRLNKLTFESRMPGELWRDDGEYG